jgi:sulfite reductase subunit B
MNPYLPRIVRVEKVFEERVGVKTLRIPCKIDFTPGQFVEITVFGVGEAPFTISSSPIDKEFFEITFKKVGNVTNALYNIKEGETIGFRGPYGNGWPVEKFEGKELILAGGGTGIASLRGLIRYISKKRRRFKKLYIFYGAKTPEELLYKNEIESWKKIKDSFVCITVDNPTKEWKDYVGPVSAVIDKVEIKISKSARAAVCGPPIMMKLCVEALLKKGLKEKNIFISLERLMQCGIGVCGHCNINEFYVCKDGPVFCFQKIKDLKELW